MRFFLAVAYDCVAVIGVFLSGAAAGAFRLVVKLGSTVAILLLAPTKKPLPTIGKGFEKTHALG